MHSRFVSGPLYFALLGTCSAFLTVARADFPQPARLPSQPDLPDPLVMLDGTRVTTKEHGSTNAGPN